MKRTELRRGKPLTRSRMTPWRPKPSVVRQRRDVYALVDARDGGSCAMCGGPAPKGQREHSHRSHAGHGGSPASMRASNVVLSCVPCNRSLSDLAVYARLGRRYGWLIGRGADPERTPFLHDARGWVLLADDGTFTPTKEK